MLGSSKVSPRNNVNNNSSNNDNSNIDVEMNGTPYTTMEFSLPSSSDDCESEDVDFISAITADGIHDTSGYLVVALVIFVGDTARGIMFPSLWPLVQALGGTHVTLGYAVAAFSFGRILVNPVFGSWSITYGYTNTLLCSCSILLLGALVYGQVQNVGRAEFLIVAQTILGIGSGTLGVTRAFVADVTAKRSRTTYIAWITAVQYAGFTVSPVFGALFNYKLADMDWKYGYLRINMYTAPAYLLATFVAITLLVLGIFFRNKTRIEVSKDVNNRSKRMSRKRQFIEQVANKTVFCTYTVYDCCLLGCMLLAIAPEGTVASFETLGVSFAESNFNMTSSQAGFVVSICGSFGVLSLLLIGYLSYRYKTSDAALICTGMMNMAIGILNLAHIDSSQEQGPSWRYMISIFMIYSVGFPVGHTAVIGLFSKLVGRRPQGTMLGWFVSTGSLARMLFPILSGYIVHYKDIGTVFVILVVMLLISLVCLASNLRTFTLLTG